MSEHEPLFVLICESQITGYQSRRREREISTITIMSGKAFCLGNRTRQENSRGLNDEIDRSVRRCSGNDDDSHRLWHHLQTNLNLEESSPSKKRNFSSSYRDIRSNQTSSSRTDQALCKARHPVSSTSSSCSTPREGSDDYYIGADLADGNGIASMRRQSSYEEEDCTTDLPTMNADSRTGGSLARRARSTDLLSYHC
jgi:hypothetical protein